jgi:CheY-like chemotaxis protein
MKTLEIPEGATILVVEDSVTRRHFFVSQHRAPDAFLAYTPSQAISLLKSMAFDFVFLDFDLEGTHKTTEVAQWIAQNRYPASVVVHSTNPWGWTVLSRILPAATVQPFGSFEVMRLKRIPLPEFPL